MTSTSTSMQGGEMVRWQERTEASRNNAVVQPNTRSKSVSEGKRDSAKPRRVAVPNETLYKIKKVYWF